MNKKLQEIMEKRLFKKKKILLRLPYLAAAVLFWLTLLSIHMVSITEPVRKRRYFSAGILYLTA